MKPRRFDQLWNRWLLIESGDTFNEWLDSLRARRVQKNQYMNMSVSLDALRHQQAFAGLGGLLGGIQSLGQIGMPIYGAFRR